jgi:hypothetical protein
MQEVQKKRGKEEQEEEDMREIRDHREHAGDAVVTATQQAAVTRPLTRVVSL